MRKTLLALSLVTAFSPMAIAGRAVIFDSRTNRSVLAPASRIFSATLTN
jgi:hypothetical protein